MFSYHIKEMREGNQFMYSLLSLLSRGCKFFRVIRTEDQATKLMEALSVNCKEFISILVSRFCMTNRAEKQVAAKMRIYLVTLNIFLVLALNTSTRSSLINRVVRFSR